MSFLLTKKLEHENACETAIRGGDSRAAVFHAAKVAEFGFALAGQTTGTVAQRYLEDAEGWLEIAERIKKTPLKVQKPEAGGQRPGGSREAMSDSDQQTPDDWLISEKPSVTFDQIAGMEEAKQALREMVVYPLQQPDKARKLGLKPGGGILLYGPPGTGKTTLAKAAANQLDAPFFYASGAQLRSKWHGESEQKLRRLIQTAKAQPVAILFLDDLDGLLPKRGGNSVVDNRIVVQFLAEVGGFEESDNVLMILGATNKPWDIDEAVFRTGRFDEKIYIGIPDEPARLGILHIHLDKVPLQEGFDFAKWTQRLAGYTGSDIVGIVSDAKRSSLSRSIRDNAEPGILEQDLENAFKTIPSSVTERMLKDYARFREARFA